MWFSLASDSTDEEVLEIRMIIKDLEKECQINGKRFDEFSVKKLFYS